MTHVVVLGAGYAGAATVASLRDDRCSAEVTWVSQDPDHFVLHEAHRIVATPVAAQDLTIPADRIAGPRIRFVQGTVVGIDTDDRSVRRVDGSTVSYDLLVVTLGSETRFYGLPGVPEHALPLKGRRDALAIHRAVVDAGRTASPDAPASIVVGGAGLSGVQVAGELARLRDDRGLPLGIRLVEALDRALPTEAPPLSRAATERIRDRDIELLTGHPVAGATADMVDIEGHEAIPVDVLVWTGGIAGRPILADGGIATEDGRVRTDRFLRTSDAAVFAIADAAAIDADGGSVPPTAQAAWQAGEAAAENVIRTVDGRPLEPFRYRDRGTILSIGETALAHDVPGFTGRTFDGPPAAVLKKLVAARWIATLTDWPRGLRVWSSL